MADKDQKDQSEARRGRGRRLVANVHVVTDDEPGGKWYGPSYPDAGEPPEGSVHDGAYEDESALESAVLASIMELEGAADDTREPSEEPQGPDGAARTGDAHRSAEAIARVTSRRR